MKDGGGRNETQTEWSGVPSMIDCQSKRDDFFAKTLHRMNENILNRQGSNTDFVPFSAVIYLLKLSMSDYHVCLPFNLIVMLSKHKRMAL